MSGAAERREALIADGEGSASLTDRLLAQLLLDLGDLRDDFKRREERRLKATGAIPQGAPSNGGVTFPNYGRKKGEPVAGADMGDLEYYAAGCRRTLDDPNKARWHDKERALLAAIEAEIARQSGRGGQGDGAGDFGGPPPDDEIPF